MQYSLSIRATCSASAFSSQMPRGHLLPEGVMFIISGAGPSGPPHSPLPKEQSNSPGLEALALRSQVPGARRRYPTGEVHTLEGLAKKHRDRLQKRQV